MCRGARNNPAILVGRQIPARRGPQEGRLLVTSDGRNVPGLPVDEQLRSFVDLRSEQMEWQARLPIATGLGPGQHVVRLTLAESADAPTATVDAFIVTTGERPPFPGLPVAGLGLGMAVMVGLLAVERRRRPQRANIF